MHGSGVLTHSANAFCVILMNLRGLVVVRLQPRAVGDDGIAVEVHARVLPGEEAHVGAELAGEHVMQVEERGRCIDGLGLERAELRVGVDVDPRDRVRIDAVRLRQRRPHRARAVARRIADLLAGEILQAIDAGALEPVEALRRIGVDVHQADEIEALAAEEQHAGHVGQAELRGARGDLLRRSRRAAPGLELDVDARRLCTSPFSARRNTAHGRRRRPS